MWLWRRNLICSPTRIHSATFTFLTFSCETCLLEEIDFASCASDNTTFVSEAIPENVMKSVESRSATLLEWFLNNQMRDNVNKCKKLWRLSCPVQSKKLSKFFSQRVNKLLASISKYKITWILENAYHIFQSMSLQKHWYHHPTWTF